MKTILIASAAAAVLSLPAPASARTDCSYASGPVYAETTSGSSGTSDSADIAVGACIDNVAPAQGLYGGLVEAGVGLDNGQVAGRQDVLGARVPGVYAIYDGDDANTLVSTSLGGYAGVSNFENGYRGSCSSGTGTNSGDCLVIFHYTEIPGVPVACGNYTGKSWETSGRDGCDAREIVDCCGAAAPGRDREPGRRE